MNSLPPLPVPEGLSRTHQYQINSLRLGFWAVGGGALSLAALVFLQGLSFDRLIQVAFLGVILGLLVTLRTQIMATQLWRVLATNIEGNFNSLYSAHIGLLDATAKDRALGEAIKMIPEGWMSSYGMMNVSRHNAPNRTGPTCFLWRPDVALKNGKIESRAVTGYGDTICDAIVDATTQAKATYDPTPT